MQLMPATARWTAKKIGLPYTPAMITDRDTNLRLGTAYLKLVLDDFGGSQADGRRRLQRRPGPAAQVARRPAARAADLGREHPVHRDARLRQEGAVATPPYYAALLGGKRTPTLAPRPPIGPRDRDAPAVDSDLP